MDSFNLPLPVVVPGEVGVPFTAAALFGRACPLEVEIGVGKGLFLHAWALAHPEIGVIGVERAGVYASLAAARAARAGLMNVRVLHTTAEDLLNRCLGAASVRCVHIYFPDPWPKKRHQKRRFFRPDNVALVAAVLAPGGLLRVKTDHPGYAEVIAEVLAAEPGLRATAVDEAFAEVPPTNFEIKYAVEARPVFRFAFLRPPAADSNPASAGNSGSSGGWGGEGGLR